MQKLYENYDTPIVLTTLYILAVTAGYTQSRVEAMFSALTRVDSSHRRSQHVYRKANLAFLHFEKEITRSITFEEYTFAWKLKPRALNF